MTNNTKTVKKIFVLQSPSGGGKTRLVGELQRYGFGHFAVHTNRLARPGEQSAHEGGDRYFMSPEEFDKIYQAQEFFFSMALKSDDKSARYGWSKKILNKLLERHDEILVQCMQKDLVQFTKILSSSSDKEVRIETVIMHYPLSAFPILEKRMRERGDHEEVIASRMALNYADHNQYITTCKNLEKHEMAITTFNIYSDSELYINVIPWFLNLKRKH